MTDTPQEPRLPPSLRFLKWLVIVLMLTMIGGVITITSVLVTRMPEGNAKISLPDDLPDGLALPTGLTPTAVTMGRGWIAVVTSDQRMFIFNADGSLRQEIEVLPATPD